MTPAELAGHSPPGQRHITARKCRTCRRQTLITHDRDSCAFTLTLDATPTNQLGLLLAHLAGRGSVLLHWRSRHIVASPIPHPNRVAGAGDIHAEHDCWQELPVVESVLEKPETNNAGRENNECPF